MANNYPKISICILSHNSEKTIKECLKSIEKIDYPDFETIIIDDNSIDNSKKIIKTFNTRLVKVFKKSKIGKLRNIAINNSNGKFIAFTDSDCFVQKNWLKELLKGFSNENIAGVGGINVTPKNNSNFQKAIGNFLEFSSFFGSNYVRANNKISETEHNPSCNVMYKKKILKKVQGFNEEIASNEDPEIDARITKKGYKLIFNPKAIVFHHRKKTITEFYKQAEWYGKGRIQAIKKNKALIQWFRIIPVIYNILMLIFLFTFFGMFGLMIGLLTITAIAWGIIISYNYSLKKPLTYSMLFIAWWFGYSIGTIKGIIYTGGN